MEIPTIVSYAVYALIGLICFIRLIRGLTGGICRETIRAITVVGSAGLSYFACTRIYPIVFSFVSSKTPDELIATVDGFLANFSLSIPAEYADYIRCVEPEIAGLLLAIPIMLVIIPVLYVLAFLLLSLVLKLLQIILCGIFGFTKKNNNAFTRLLGGVLGVVHGLFIAAAILFPAVGTYSVVKNAVLSAEQEYPDSQNSVTIANTYHSYMDGLEDNIAVSLIDEKLGFLYDNFITVKINGETVNLGSVASDAFDLFVLYGDLGGADLKNPTKENKQTIDQMIDCIGDDIYIKSLVSGILRAVPRAVDAGLIPLEYDESVDGFVDSFIKIFETSNSANVKGDLKTVAQVYYILTDIGVFSSESSENLMDKFMQKDSEGKNAIEKISAALKSNDRFITVALSITDLAVNLVLENAGIDPEVMNTVEDIKGTLNDIVSINKNDYETEEEYKAEVSTKIDTTLTENGIPLDEEQLSMVTDFVCTELEGKEEITEADLVDFMAKYYSVYVGEGGELPEEIPEDVIDGILGGNTDEIPWPMD